MGKHKNQSQISILIEFMEENPDLAKGFSKQDKSLVNSLWQELAETLNAAGPPTKDVNGWKKEWAEWKSEVKKKLGENTRETRGTGGGPLSKHTLTQSEEAIARICAMTRAVEGVPGISLEQTQEMSEEQNDDIPTISSKRTSETPPASSTPKKRKEDVSQRLTLFLDEDSENKKDLNSLLGELIKAQKENAGNIRRVYKAIEMGMESFEKTAVELKNELCRISVGVLTAMQEKNELKKRQLDLKLLKHEYETKKK